MITQEQIDRIIAAAPPGPSGTSAPEPRIKDIRGLMRLVPNEPSVDRDLWVTRAFQIRALAVDEHDGELAFDGWSQKHASYDAAETQRVWDSIHSIRISGLGLLRDAEAADPVRFAAFINGEARAAFSDDVEPPKVPLGRGRVQFKLGGKGEILLSKANAERALSGLDIVCRYDEFHHRFWIQRGEKSEKLTDHAVLLLRGELDREYGKDFGPVHIGDALTTLGLQNSFNPICDMLTGAELFWDGVKRLDRLGPDYFHTEDTELARRCFRKVMIAAVRRARHPGVKFDQILVTESPEGWDKSSAWAVLAGAGNFSDADILGKDARQVQEELADIWIHEIADLSGLSKADIEHVKAFASRTNDRARPAYGRYLIDQPRQSIEVGTTNADIYMMSQTGNRRFWPFQLSAPVDLVLLCQDRLQLWGEAAVAESAGETLVLDRHLWDEAGQEQEKRRVIDTWEDELVNLPEERMQDWDGDQFISNLAVQEYLGGYRRQAFNSGSGRKIAEIMKRLGWEKCSRKIDGLAHRGYKRGKSTSVTASVTYLKPGKLL